MDRLQFLQEEPNSQLSNIMPKNQHHNSKFRLKIFTFIFVMKMISIFLTSFRLNKLLFQI